MKKYEMLPRMKHDKSKNFSSFATSEEIKQMGKEAFEDIIRAFAPEDELVPEGRTPEETFQYFKKRFKDLAG
jgi:hypothetical protein